MFKNMIKSTAALMMLVVSTNLVFVPKSHAAGVVLGISAIFLKLMKGPESSDLTPVGEVLTYSTLAGCILGLGIFAEAAVIACVLGEESKKGMTWSSDYFSENGYTSDEERLIRSEHERFVRALAAQDAAIITERHDTHDTLAREMRAIVPELDELYVDFVAGSLGIK